MGTKGFIFAMLFGSEQLPKRAWSYIVALDAIRGRAASVEDMSAIGSG
jgi:hypothetical protein